jgi:hypothetical protein
MPFCSRCGVALTSRAFPVAGLECCDWCKWEVLRQEERRAVQEDPFMAWLYAARSDDPEPDGFSSEAISSFFQEETSGLTNHAVALAEFFHPKMRNAGVTVMDHPPGPMNDVHMMELNELAMQPLKPAPNFTATTRVSALRDFLRAGGTVADASKLFRMCRKTVRRWRERLGIAPDLCGCGKENSHRGWCSSRAKTAYRSLSDPSARNAAAG